MAGTGFVDVASSDPLTVAYSDQTSFTLGDICVEIQCVYQVQDEFVGCVASDFHNACRQLDIDEDLGSWESGEVCPGPSRP